MGLFINSTRGLAFVNVSGLNLVPKPPTKSKAFLFIGFYDVVFDFTTLLADFLYR